MLLCRGRGMEKEVRVEAEAAPPLTAQQR